MPGAAPVERYGLYGEPVREVELNFMHVEPIRLRSGRFDWVIEPHSHGGLHQIMLVTGGRGTMRTDESQVSLEAASLVIVPAGTVHGFAFEPGTDGWIATVADDLVLEIARIDPAALGVFAALRCRQPVSPADTAALDALLAGLAQELVWSVPLGRLAVRADLMRLLVAAGRLADIEPPADAPAGDVALTEAFRRLVESHFREGLPIAAYAKRLGVSEDRLLAACRRRFGETPIALVHRRLVIEAQRWLAYSNRDVGEISRELGFADPAYFSRFFKRKTRVPPSLYRTRRLTAADASLMEVPASEQGN